MKRLYVSDLDGTLFNSKKELTEESAAMINSCIEKGVLFSIATARMPYGCDYRLEALNMNVPGVLTNGVFLYDFGKKEYVHAEKIEKDAALRVIQAFEKNEKDFFMYLFHESEISICFRDDTLKLQEQYYSKRALENCKNVYQTEDYRKETEKGDVVYFALTGKECELKPICETLDDIAGIQYTCYLNIYNGMYCLEIFSDRASKKYALLRLKEMLGCDELIVFGDNLNDLPMIEIADRSYAPKNALEEVKKIVTEVIDDCDHDGVAKKLQEEIK